MRRAEEEISWKTGGEVGEANGEEGEEKGKEISERAGKRRGGSKFKFHQQETAYQLATG